AIHHADIALSGQRPEARGERNALALAAGKARRPLIRLFRQLNRLESGYWRLAVTMSIAETDSNIVYHLGLRQQPWFLEHDARIRARPPCRRVRRTGSVRHLAI
ncbi:MAG TPA: hypothetical protein VL418_03205, partial [Devosiaceae bacterium]|nr:hypothetical protein [Devosiaceae bacterium]